MIRIVLTSTLVSLALFFTKPLYANTNSDFQTHLNIWNKKGSLASSLLKKAEESFQNGDKIEGCKNQTRAALYGIEATESLIKAFEISQTTSDFEDLYSGLDKWRELRDFCDVAG